jgi:hypothetical protein
MRPGFVKCKFTAAEDTHLLAVISQGTLNDWTEVAKEMPGRTARQCRERWNNYVNPEITTVPWTEEEELLLARKHSELGSRWGAILHWFPGRSKNQLKNHWFAQQRRAKKRTKIPKFAEKAGTQEEQESPFALDDSSNWGNYREFGCMSD